MLSIIDTYVHMFSCFPVSSVNIKETQTFSMAIVY